MAEETLVTEEIRQAVGSLTNICVTRIESNRIKMFCDATGDKNPLWQDEDHAIQAGYASTLVPPGFLITMQIEGESPGFYTPYLLHLKGAIDAGGAWEFFKPVKAGDTIIVDRKFVDFYEKKGSLGLMLLCIFETTYRNQKGEIVAKGRWTAIRVPAPGVNDYEGRKVD